MGLFVSGVIGGHVTLTGARLVHGLVCVWCDRGHVTLTGARLVHGLVCVWCDRGSCDSHRCAARSWVGLCLV